MGSTSETSEMVNTVSSSFLNFAPGIFVDILSILWEKEKLITKHRAFLFDLFYSAFSIRGVVRFQLATFNPVPEGVV